MRKTRRGGGANMVAVSYSTGYIASSTDGNTWASRTPNAFGGVNGVAYGNGLWVAVGTNEGNPSIKNVSTSSNGTTWIGQTSNAGINNISNVAYGKNSSGNGVWVMCGSNKFATSPNGTSWTACATNGGLDNAVINVAFGKDNLGADLWIGIGYASIAENTIVRSTDGGNSWVACATNGGINSYGRGVAYGLDASGAGLWVAVGQPTTGGNAIAYSSNGNNWTACTNAQADSLIYNNNCVAYGKDASGAGLWVIAGVASISRYPIATSPDGINWTKRLVNTAFTNNVANSVAYGQDALGNWLWVAVGNGGNCIATSTNGTTWTGITSTGGLSINSTSGVAFKK